MFIVEVQVKEAQGAARMTITMSPELKKEMDAVKESVNWSAVAAEAFRHKLLELQSTRKGTTMDDAVSRMKAAQELENKESYNHGYSAGRAWLKYVARPAQMRRLEAAYDDQFFDGEPDAFGWAGVLCSVIQGDHEGDRSAIAEFWETALAGPHGLNLEDVPFLTGFIEGALADWKWVKTKL